MDDINKLLDIVNSNKKEKKSRRVLTNKTVDSFIEEFKIEAGTQKIPNQVLFYVYRMFHLPEHPGKANKDTFFKIMHKKFPSMRKNNQRYFLLKEGVINLTDELQKKAIIYDKNFWKKKPKKKLHQHIEEGSGSD